jgi:hypothetical protein
MSHSDVSSWSYNGRCAALAVAAALGMIAAGPALANEPELETETEPQAELTEGERQLAKLLEGRVAGEPMACLQPARNMPSTTIHRTAYVYGRGATIYVQRTQTPDLIDRNAFLVSQINQPTRLCRMDMFNVVDRLMGFPIGAVVFEDFIPYRRVKPAR